MKSNIKHAKTPIPSLVICALLLASCAESDNTPSDEQFYEANTLVGTRWKVDVFNSSDGSNFRSDPGFDWIVTFDSFEVFTDFEGEATMSVVFPCGDKLNVPFILKGTSFVVDKGLIGVGSVDGDGTCIPDPHLDAHSSLDHMFTSNVGEIEYSLEAVVNQTIQITSTNNDLLGLSKLN